ncbi:TPA: PD-(D/E)XK nuclease-like domain-containing protein [Serratia marcescens]|nr:PD-(D/E)XK nuclease-like domain-containing protein [Serratia marcescens]HEJ8056719.1 PD-(D/E)XK nuclease-like domain-containing protein [Serratia marcescens]
MQNVYAYHLKAKQKSGKPSLFIWFEAKNDARAKRDLENHIEDAELDQSAYFKPVRTNYPVVDDLPPEAAFCDTWCLRYKLDDNLSWQVIPATDREQVQEQHKPAGDAGAANEATNDGGEPAHGQEPRAYFAKMSADTRAVAVILHGFEVIDTVLSKSQMTNVINTALSGESAYIADMLQALRLPAVSCMDPERFAAFVAGVARRYEETDPESTFINIRKYVEQLLKPAPEPEAETTKTVHKRGYTQTHDALDREIACALWVGDVDCQNIAGEIDRWAQKKIKNDDEDFKRWSMALRAAPNILKYSRETIFGVVRNVPSSDMYHFPATLRGWIEKYLSEHGVYEFGAAPDAVHLVAEPEPEPEPEQTCKDASSDDEKAEVAQRQESEPAADCAQAYFEPGRYADISNTAYHAANGISSTQVKDARISLMYYHGRHVIKTIGRERSDALTFGSLVHTLALEPENLERDFNVEPIIPDGAFTNTASMRAFIEQHNANLPKQTDADTLRAVIEKHNATLPASYALGGNYEETAQFYVSLPVEFQSLATAEPTASAMKGCIKKYNATLPAPLKTTGGRDALLEQLATIDPEFVEKERAIPAPLPVSGSKEDMAARIKTILPTAVFADEVIDAWKNSDDGRQQVTQQQMQHAKAIQRALFTHPSAGPLLQHEHRAVEASYFGFDEETGLEVRVRPDLEIDLNSVRVGVDLKSVSMGRVKQDALRAKLHREIIDRDYHLSAAMYSDIAAFDQFFWIFVNKDEGYHWVAIVEASPDLLELGRLEYKKALREIKNAFDTDIWPAPITEEIVDDLNDYDQRRMEALRVA